jgi:hypothetical protein
MLPLREEVARVSRRTVEAGQVRIAVTTGTQHRLLREKRSRPHHRGGPIMRHLS